MLRKILLSTAALGLIAAPALAENYRLSTHGPEAHPLHGNAVPIFAKSVDAASNGRIKFEPFMSAALAQGGDTLKTVKTGVAQGGLIISAYTPSDLPLNVVLSSSTVSMSDQYAATIAITQLTMTNPELQAEWNKAGVVFGGGLATAPLWLYCTSSVTKPEELVGKKVWPTSGTQAAIVSALGGVPVTVSVNDVYSGLQRGSLDCATNDSSGVIGGFRWGEMAKNITTMSFGMVTGAMLVYNQDFWKSLTADDRRLLMDQMALSQARMLADYLKVTEENVAGGKTKGVAIVEPTPELIAARDNFNTQYQAKLAQEAVEKRGIADPTPVMQEFNELVAAWTKKLEGVDRRNPEAVAAIIKAEIFDKLDAATFGVSN